MVVTESKPRAWIARTFTLLEDVVYVALGLLLAASALVLLGSSAVEFFRQIAEDTLTQNIVVLLDRLLLVFLVVELLYTVRVSFREHSIAPEPFLLVGVIAGIRRVLVITAEFGHAQTVADTILQRLIMELGILTVLIPVLVWSLLMLQKRRVTEAEKD
jgi:uncharacterized membrane protein (DUF373 family)